MTDYQTIEERCHESSRHSATVLDDFLLSYIAYQEGLEARFERRLGQYQTLMSEMPEDWSSWLMSQCFAHEIFGRRGLAAHYHHKPDLQWLSSAESAWLNFQIANPWQWRFCRIVDSPAANFFTMEDLCTSEQVLTYSPSISNILAHGEEFQMWLLLLGFNGACYQTYGVLMPFKGFLPSDLLLAGQGIDRALTDVSRLPALIDRDPLPFVLLYRFSNSPFIAHGKDLLILNRIDLNKVALDESRLTRRFKVERRGHVLRLQLRRWASHPHFAVCYYNEQKLHLRVSAMTDRGWAALVSALHACGIECPSAPKYRGTMASVIALHAITGVDFAASPSEPLFQTKPAPEEAALLDGMNAFLELYTAARNEGRPFAVEQAAQQAGIDRDTAYSILSSIDRTLLAGDH